MAKLDKLFQMMMDANASDLHLVTSQKPAMRIDGKLEYVEAAPVLDDESLRSMLYELASEEKLSEFKESRDVDFSYEIEDLARFRANYFEQRTGVGAVFRHIPNNILTLEALGMPKILKKTAMLQQGLVLVTGPTGSGKSTTLAGIIDYANKHRRDHILTIEDPVEFVHESQGCLVNHREVGRHTQSFAVALRAALREDPNIILVGEMRDLETIALAIEAASTGHLVFGTLHTQSATKTVDRIIDVFPTEQQEKIRVTLSETLKVVVAQNLLPRVDQPGRCAVLEILVCTPAVSAMIREGKTYQLISMMQTGKRHGMQLLDDSIEALLNKGWIEPETAHEKSIDKKRFAALLPEDHDVLN
ncbi:MAG: type IV pilus twitching motility protein PilT [SAR324 cluster bacterium]|nr:type IV pilus twitching motility protein PilT [SAR324 cluster bacterium]